MSGGVEGLFLVISHTFPIYKQLSTQGTITSCSLNKLDVKNHWVLRDLENPQALSSALAALRRYSPGPSSFLNPVEPWFLTSNYYLKLIYQEFLTLLATVLNFKNADLAEICVNVNIYFQFLML